MERDPGTQEGLLAVFGLTLADLDRLDDLVRTWRQHPHEFGGRVGLEQDELERLTTATRVLSGMVADYVAADAERPRDRRTGGFVPVEPPPRSWWQRLTDRWAR